jgi:hypothetical protein
LWEWRAFNTCGWAHGKYGRLSARSQGHSPAASEDWDAEDYWQPGDDGGWFKDSDWMEAEQGHVVLATRKEAGEEEGSEQEEGEGDEEKVPPLALLSQVPASRPMKPQARQLVDDEAQESDEEDEEESLVDSVEDEEDSDEEEDSGDSEEDSGDSEEDLGDEEEAAREEVLVLDVD